MSIILLLVFGMVLQANRSITAHNKTANGVLSDYARLAANEYSRGILAAVGYYGYYALISPLTSVASESPETITGVDTRATEGDGPSLYVFSILTPASVVSVSNEYVVSPAIRNYLSENIAVLYRESLPETGYTVQHALLDGEQHTFVVAWLDRGPVVFGFEVSRVWLARTLQTAFAEKVLLPETLAGGAVTNDLLQIAVRDTQGAILFQTESSFDTNTVIEKRLGDEYGGVFRGHTISAAIDSAHAKSLVIGGLPKSRLPMLVVIFLLAIGLLIVAIRQLQRENAVMQMRAAFIAEVSHELRTPLAQIRLFAESLQFDRLRATDDKNRALLIINRESQRLIHMVENILRFSDNERSENHLSKKAQDLAPIVRSVADEFSLLADSRGAAIETQISPSVVAAADADAIRQILLNLLDNAVKYGPTGQTITVSLAVENGSALISVADQGPGIPSHERKRIWESYYRLDRERDSAISGAGIGLSVIANLVHQHGAEVRVENVAGGGSRFVIEIPQ